VDIDVTGRACVFGFNAEVHTVLVVRVVARRKTVAVRVADTLDLARNAPVRRIAVILAWHAIAVVIVIVNAHARAIVGAFWHTTLTFLTTVLTRETILTRVVRAALAAALAPMLDGAVALVRLREATAIVVCLTLVTLVLGNRSMITLAFCDVAQPLFTSFERRKNVRCAVLRVFT